MGEGARGREKDRYTRLACVAGVKRGGRGGREKARRRGKGKGEGRVPYPLSPIPLPFSLSRYPQPLSTPATQAKRPPAFNPLKLSKRWRFFSLGTSATTTATAAKTSPKSGIRAVPNFVALIQTLLVSGFVPKRDILLITFFNPI